MGNTHRWGLVVLFLLACAVHGVLRPEEVRSQEKANVPAEARPGFVANRVHPGDPVQEILVAGFSDQAPAVAFVAAGMVAGKTPPPLSQKLAPGQSVQFGHLARPWQAAVLVLYYLDEKGQPTLLALLKAHADIPLAVGSCGYQLLIGVDQASAPPPPKPAYAPR
jgi:hypothetical protein